MKTTEMNKLTQEAGAPVLFSSESHHYDAHAGKMKSHPLAGSCDIKKKKKREHSIEQKPTTEWAPSVVVMGILRDGAYGNSHFFARFLNVVVAMN